MPEDIADPGETQDGNVQTPEAEGAEQTPAKGAKPDADTVDARLRQVEERYDNLRSHTDRVSTKNHDLELENAKLKAQFELLQSQQQRGVSPEAAAREQEDFDKNWRTQLVEDPGKAIDFFRGTARELREQIRQEVLADLKREVGGLASRLEEFDPDYRAHKDAVDSLMKDLGLSRQQATAVAKRMAPAQPANQRSTPPGRVEGQGRVTSEDDEVASFTIPPGELAMMRSMGLNDDAIKRIREGTAKELAASRRK